MINGTWEEGMLSVDGCTLPDSGVFDTLPMLAAPCRNVGKIISA